MGTEVGGRALGHIAGHKAQGQLCGAQVVPCALGLSPFHQHPESSRVEQGGGARCQCLIRGVPEPRFLGAQWPSPARVSGPAVSTSQECGGGCRLGARAQPWTPDFRILRVTLLPGGTLHTTSTSRVDVGAYRCVPCNVASTRHGGDAQLTLSGKQGPGESEWALGKEEGMGSWCHWEQGWPKRL